MNPEITNPYVGPRAFREEENKLFFGRERESRELLSLVLSERLVLFYAQSGAGKSSLLNTMLIPSMKERGIKVLPVGRVSGDTDLEVKNIYIFNLLRTLSPAEKELTEISKQPLTDFFADLNDKPEGSGEDGAFEKFFLIIDQFEELFSTHNEEWEKREDFFKQLNLILQDNPNLWVLIAMREDYIASLDPYTASLPGRLRTRYYMQQLEREAALNAIRGPVISDGFSRPYADGVAEKLVDDLRLVRSKTPDGKESSHLGQFIEPLILQVICYDIWVNLRSPGPQITANDMQEVGEVNEFLKNYYAKRVNIVAGEWKVSERKIRKWFTERLISSTGVRNMILHERGSLSSGLENDVILALPDLVRQHQRGSVMFYELSHDRLVNLILEDNKEWEEKHASYLQKQAALWLLNGRLESHLITDNALNEMDLWAKQNPRELASIDLEFLEACKKRRKTQRNKILLIVSAVAVVFVFFVFYFRSQQLAAVRLKEQADFATSNVLSRVALDVSGRQLDLAILLGLEAYGIDQNTQTDNALITILQRVGNLQDFFSVSKNTQAVNLLPDAQSVAVLDESGVMILDMSGQFIQGPFLGIPSPVFSTAFSPDGKILAASSKDGSIILWDAASGDRIGKPINSHTNWVNRVMFSADGSTLVSASDDYTIGIWDITDPLKPKNTRTIALDEGVNDAILSSKGLLAGTDATGRIYLWNLDKFEPSTHPALIASTTVFQMAFNSDGSLLLYADDNGAFYLADVSNSSAPKQLFEPISHTSSIYRVAFSPNSNIIALGDDAGGIVLYNVSDPAKPQLLSDLSSEHTKRISGLAFSLDNQTLVSAGEDGQIIFWDVSTKQVKARRSIRTVVNNEFSFSNNITFSPSGDRLSTALENGMILIWDVADISSPHVSRQLLGDDGVPDRIEMSSDGKYLILYNFIPSLYHDKEFLSLVDVATGIKTEIGAGEIVSQTEQGLLTLAEIDDETGYSRIRFYDLVKGQPIYAPIENIANFSFSADESILIYETYESDTNKSVLHFFDIQAGREYLDPQSGYFFDFSGDTLAYYAAGENGENIYSDDGLYPIVILFNITTGEQRQVPGAFTDLLQNGQFIFSRFQPEEIQQIFSTTSDELIEEELLIYEGSPVRQAFLSANQQYVVLTSYSTEAQGYQIQIYNTETGQKVYQPLYSTLELHPIDLSESGRYLIATSNENETQKVQIYDASSGRLIDSRTGELKKHPEVGKFLIYETGYGTDANTINLLDTSTGNFQKVVGRYINQIDAGNKIIYYDANGVNVWDAQARKNVSTAMQGTYLGVSADGKRLFTWAEQDDKVLAWDLTKTWSLGNVIDETILPATVTTLSPNGKIVAWVDEDGINLTDTFQGESLGNSFNEHRSNQITTYNYQLSPDGKILAYLDWELSTYAVINLATGDLIAKNIPGEGLSFSPDGNYFVITNNINNSISVRDVKSGDLLLEEIPGLWFAFSPIENLLAVGDTSTNTTSIWDLGTKKELGTQLAGYQPIFSPSGKTVAIQNPDLNDISIWDVKTKNLLPLRITGYLPQFSPNGNLLVAADEGTVRVWDVISQKEISDGLVGDYSILSSDGKFLAVGDSISYTFTLWDVTERKIVIDRLSGYSLKFSPNGKKLIFLDYDTEGVIVRVWDTAKRDFDLNNVIGSVYTFSPDSTLLAVGDFYTNTTKILNLENGMVLEGDIPGDSATFSPDSKKLLIQAFVDNYAYSVWDIEAGKMIFEALEGESAQFSPDSRLLILNTDNAVKLLDIQNQNEIPNQLPAYSSRFFALDGDTILTTDSSTSITTIWNIADARDSIEPLNIIQTLPKSLVFSSDSRMLASVVEDEVVIWDINKLTSTQRLFIEGYESQFMSSSFYDNNTKFAVLSENGDLITWDLSKSPPTSTIEDNWVSNPTLIYQSAFSPNGNYLVYDANEGRPSVWDLTQKKVLSLPEQFAEIEAFVGSIAFSPDGVYMAYSDGGKIFMYTFPALRKLGELSTGLVEVSDIEIILEDSTVKYVISQDDSGNTQLWDWESRTKAGSSMPGKFRLLGSNSTDKSFIYLDSSDKLIKANWQLDINAWQNILCPLAHRNITEEEWNTYFPDTEYRITCSAYPSGKPDN